MSKLRIGLLVDSLSGGGAERQAIIMASELSRRVEHVELIQYHPQNDYMGFVEERGITPTVVSGGGRLRRVVRLANYLKKKRFDVIHCVKGHVLPWGYLSARLAGVRCVFGGCRNTHLPLRPKWLYRYLSRRIAGWIANGDSVKAHVIGQLSVSPGHVSVVYNGLLPEMWQASLPRATGRAALGLGDEQLAVAMVAGLRAEKNHRMLLEAAVDVAEIVPSVRFLIVGDGPERESLERYARAIGAEDNVKFMGKRADIPNVLCAVDLVALSSNSEGLPNVLLEAGAAGRACVCTDVGDSARVVKDRKTGYVVPCGDVNGFSGRIIELLCDGGLRARMGQAAMEYVRPTFSVEAMGDRLMNAYHRGLKQRGGRSEVGQE